jgi:hypothetical protein
LNILTHQVRKLAENIDSDREKTLARLASVFVFLLANHKFYSHLASWRVVICTPDVRQKSSEHKKLNIESPTLTKNK